METLDHHPDGPGRGCAETHHQDPPVRLAPSRSGSRSRVHGTFCTSSRAEEHFIITIITTIIITTTTTIIIIIIIDLVSPTTLRGIISCEIIPLVKLRVTSCYAVMQQLVFNVLAAATEGLATSAEVERVLRQGGCFQEGSDSSLLRFVESFNP